MSNFKATAARVLPSKESPTPPYFYQSYEGKGGSASADRGNAPERKFAELQNLVVAAA